MKKQNRPMQLVLPDAGKLMKSDAELRAYMNAEGSKDDTHTREDVDALFVLAVECIKDGIPLPRLYNSVDCVASDHSDFE